MLCSVLVVLYIFTRSLQWFHFQLFFSFLFGPFQAARNIGLKKPIIIRLEGTNVELARAVIADSGFSDTLINAEDLDDGAQKAVEIALNAA